LLQRRCQRIHEAMFRAFCGYQQGAAATTPQVVANRGVSEARPLGEGRAPWRPAVGSIQESQVSIALVMRRGDLRRKRNPEQSLIRITGGPPSGTEQMFPPQHVRRLDGGLDWVEALR